MVDSWIFALTAVLYSPAAQLVPYQWVSIWSGLLPYFDFEAVGIKEVHAAENLTTAMTSPFFVRARRLDTDDIVIV